MINLKTTQKYILVIEVINDYMDFDNKIYQLFLVHVLPLIKTFEKNFDDLLLMPEYME